MRPLLLLGLCFVLLPIAWSRLAPPGVYMETWPDGTVKVRAVSTRTAEGDYVFDGPYVAYHANGRKEREGKMRDGKEEGHWTWWNEDGTRRAEGDFHRGSGGYTSYYASGEVHWRGRFRDGLRDGVWTELSKQGRKLREGPYRMDREHGAWTYWHEDDPSQTVVVRWQDGQVLEEGQRVQAPPRSTWGVSPWRHAVQMLSWWLLWWGPLPLALTVARAGSNELPAAHTALVTLILWTAAQIVVGLGLGTVHGLRLPAILATEAALLAVGVAAQRRFGVRWQPWRLPAAGPVRVMAFSWLVVALVLGWWLTSIPTDNFDSLAYHLPTLARWYQEGSLVRPAELGQVSFYPFHWEILAALQLFPFGEDLAVALPNLLAWAWLGLSVHLLARDLGSDRAGAWFATVAVSTLPVTLSRLPSVQPDLAVAASFVAASYLGRVALRQGSGPGVMAWAASLGVLLGLKGSAVGYTLVALGFAVLSGRAGSEPVRLRWRPAVAGLVVAALLGGYWYVRNWTQTGNPLGFVEVNLGGRTWWPGPVDATTLRRGTLLHLFDPARAEHWRLLVTMARSELALPFGLLMMGTAGLLRPSVRARVGARALLVLMAWILAAVLLYWITPYGADNGAEGWRLTSRVEAGLRFAFPALAALAVACAVGLSVLPRLGFVLAGLAAATTGLGLVQRVETSWETLAVAVLLALAVFAVSRAPAGVRAGVGAVLVVGLGVLLLAARSERDQWRSTLYGDAYEFVERTVARDAVLGYALTQTRFPYYGRHLDRRLVSVVPTTGSRPDWLAMLADRDVRWLLLGTTSSGEEATAFEPLVRSWVDADPDQFEQVFEYQSRRRDISVVRVGD